MRAFEFSSTLPDEYLDDLEVLLYFNRLQHQARMAIVRSLETYGQPRLSVDNGRVLVRVDGVSEVQTLFALADLDDAYELAGLVMYVREADNLVILHIAVTEVFSSVGAERDALLALRLVLAVQDVAHRLRGINAVLIHDPAGVQRRLRVMMPACAAAPPSVRTPGSGTTGLCEKDTACRV
jgi:hypothetical protein